MLKELLYQAVDWIAIVHDKIGRLNDHFEGTLSDKQLHFLVIGILGLLLVFLIHPIFLHLSRTNHVMVITWIYVFTLILVITFAVEIGQRLTKTGEMEFADIVFGVGGFIVMFAAFALIRAVITGIIHTVRKRRAAQQAEVVTEKAADIPKTDHQTAVYTHTARRVQSLPGKHEKMSQMG